VLTSPPCYGHRRYANGGLGAEGRRAVGIDVAGEYLDLARERCSRRS
jgi:hypothetical protein